MMDMENAQRLLKEGGYTCVACRDGVVYTATRRGVRPLLNWLDEGVDLMGAAVADKVVGRGAAFLYRLLGVRSVYGGVMSVAAVKVLRAGGIEASGLCWRRGSAIGITQALAPLSTAPR
jgi:hypothetical protein